MRLRPVPCVIVLLAALGGPVGAEDVPGAGSGPAAAAPTAAAASAGPASPGDAAPPAAVPGKDAPASPAPASGAPPTGAAGAPAVSPGVVPPAPAASAPVSSPAAATADTDAAAPAAVPGGNPYRGLPKVVARAVRQLEAACRKEEGTAHWSPAGVYQVVNVSTDGWPDFLIDTHAIACDGGITPWVGSDGFRYILFVSTGPGRWTRAFDRPARIFEITEAKDGQPPRLEVFSHYAHCKLPNPDRYMRCSQTYEWRRGKLRTVSEEWSTD